LFHTGAQLHRQFDRRLFFSIVGSFDATLMRWSHPSYLSVASLIDSNPNSSARRARARTPPSSPPQATFLTYAHRASSAGLPALAAGHRAAPPRPISRARRLPPQPRVAPPLAFPGRAPSYQLAGDPKEERKGISLFHCSLSSTLPSCGEHKTVSPLNFTVSRVPLHCSYA
jgi:hypothetical protein